MNTAYETSLTEDEIDTVIIIPLYEGKGKALRKDGLSKNGICIVVKPQKNHLIELKEAMYDNIKPSKEDKYNNFKIIEEHKLEYCFDINDDILRNLFKMTPFFYNVSEEKSEKISIFSTKTQRN